VTLCNFRINTRLHRGVVIQDQAGAVAASNFDCSQCLPAIKRERDRNCAVRLTGPLRSQPAGKVFQPGLGSINSDAVPEAVYVRARRNAQRVRSAIRQSRAIDRDHDAAGVAWDELAGSQNLAQDDRRKVGPIANRV
jgi:hypothetical protein